MANLQNVRTFLEVQLDGVPDDFVLFSAVRRSPLTAAVLFVAARLKSPSNHSLVL
jgi:hypothetical protein